jgi:hypothetical protein
MPMGPGKYDDICTSVRGQLGMTDETKGGVLLLVIGGKHGDGFSCQTDLRTLTVLPELLEMVASRIRRDGI